MTAPTLRTLLLLTNQELWPGIICTQHFKPDNVILLHGNTPAASKEPAVRLQKFLLNSGRVQTCELLELPDDDFVGIQRKLDERCSNEPVAVGFNGATKLMAVACFDWARQRSKQAFYLELDGQLRQFDFSGQALEAGFEATDPSSCDDLDPRQFIEAQLHHSSIPQGMRGQILCLKPDAKKVTEDAFGKWTRKHDPDLVDSHFVEPPFRDSRKIAGDNLEIETAFCLLRHGVQQVLRGVFLSPKESRDRYSAHAELDAVFIWRNRLWVVECKNWRVSELQPEENNRLKKVIKERLLSAQECGGALAQTALVVGGGWISRHLDEFASSRIVHVLRRDHLWQDVRKLLNAPPSTPEKGKIVSLDSLDSLFDRAFQQAASTT